MKILITVILTLVFITAGEARSEESATPPEISLDGLERVEKTRRREVHRAPDADWSAFEAVMIDEASVAFRKNWLRDQNRYQPNRVRKEEMERIKADMARMTGEVFTNELTGDGGFSLTDEAGENVLRVAPRIVELDVYAPDTRSSPGIQRSFAETLGRMTLEVHLFDSGSGELIAAFSEEREAPRRGYLQWSNTVSINQEFRIMLRSWARELSETLGDLRTQQP